MIEKYFEMSLPNILNNEKLRIPQIEAYTKTLEYFNGEHKNRNALVVLPTGVGKTGVMAIAPFKISKKRTLIITPGTTIRDNVLESLDATNLNNFWIKHNIFNNTMLLPSVSEYIGNKTPVEVLEKSNIVVVNIHKLQERLDTSLLKILPKDFFDFIIIDEAHHSTAQTWKDTVNYFKNAKILKLTGTPFRSDGEKIEGVLIYKYALCRAMANEYIKSLSNIVYVPDELKLTIDDKAEEFTVDQILNMGLKEQEWVSRSVAYSKECSERVVLESINLLKNKLMGSVIPHKIIAIACSIKHANEIKELYEKYNMRVTVIHSCLDVRQKEKAFSDIDNNRVDVVINIAMLGEGYDHPYLSVAAIFRPFRNELPYTQFIGRVLRKINEGNDKDNIAHIISHENLYLNDLWLKYKKEIDQKDIIKSLIENEDFLENESNSNRRNNSDGSRAELQLGAVKESNNYSISEDIYLDTELLKRSKEEDIKDQENIKKLIEIMPGITEEQAKLILQQTNSANNNPLLKRPDLLYRSKRSSIDEEIRENIVPKLVLKYELNNENKSFENCKLFTNDFWYIKNTVAKGTKGRNAAMLAIFYNRSLKKKIGTSRKQWSTKDFDNAFLYLDELNNYVDKVLKEYYNK